VAVAGDESGLSLGGAFRQRQQTHPWVGGHAAILSGRDAAPKREGRGGGDAP
jgi:hypothetical protein